MEIPSMYPDFATQSCGILGKGGGMYAGKGTFLTALSALHGDSFHVARFVHKCGNWDKGGEERHAQEGRAHGGLIFRKFQTKSATTQNV
jgi:hypothetical protein